MLLDCYKIINDEEMMVKYINNLPELQENQKYYLCLFCRNKYLPEGFDLGGGDKGQLKRFLATKENMLDKIKQLEIPKGRYYKYSNGKKYVIPQEGLALYISFNPRDLKKGAFRLQREIIKLVENDVIMNNKTSYNVHAEAMSCIHKSDSKKKYIDFDFDNVKFEDVKDEILTYINKEAIKPIITRGGFHLMIELSKIEDKYKKSYYQNIKNMEKVDICKTNILPMVGSYQGGFTPYIYELYLLK